MSWRRSHKAKTAGGAGGAMAAQSKPDSPPARQAPIKGGLAKRRILTDRAPKPVGPYSQAIVVGETVYVAGQGPIDPRTGKIVTGSFEEQATLTFDNVKAILEAAGASPADVVKVHIYLADLGDFSKMNEIYTRYFSEDFPARTTVGGQLLFQTLIEVDCIATITPGRRNS